MKKITYNIYRNLLFLLCTLAITVSCTSKQLKEEEHSNTDSVDETTVELTEAQFKNAGVKTAQLQRKSLSGVIKVNGVLDVPPQNLVTVSIPYGGTIKKMDLLQGMKVKKGQVLVVLEHPDYIQLQQDFLEAQSRLTFMELELKRQEELQKENVSAAKTHQQIVSEYASIKARVDGLQQKLSLLNINPDQIKSNGITKQVKLYAPISGYVTQINVNIGMYVTPNDIILKLVDTGHLHAELTVFEKDVTRLKVGQKIRFSFNNENAEHSASVYLIGKEISNDRTVRVHGHLEKEDHDLLPGMYIKAFIETESKEVLSIPSEAIVHFEGKQYVFLAKGKFKEGDQQAYRYEKVEVSTGIENEDFTEITSLDKRMENSDIVVVGAYDLLSVMAVSEEEGHGH